MATIRDRRTHGFFLFVLGLVLLFLALNYSLGFGVAIVVVLGTILMFFGFNGLIAK
jgi:hypothetical protein